jgi:hypothetical protein
MSLRPMAAPWTGNPNENSAGVLPTARSVLTFFAGAALVLCAGWNIVNWYLEVDQLPPRDSDELVIKEQRFAPLRINLESEGYKGEIAFVAKHDLSRVPPTPDDDKRWAQSQYVMIPWVLVRTRTNTPFLIADFSDGPPEVPLDGFVKFFDDGNGLILFKAAKSR